MAENYETLKRKRALLLTEREKIFNGICTSNIHLFVFGCILCFNLALPGEVSQIFNCLMEPLSLPSRHLQMANPIRRNRNNRKFSIQESSGRFQVKIPREALMDE